MAAELERIAVALERIVVIMEQQYLQGVRRMSGPSVAEGAKHAALEEYSATVNAAWQKYKTADDETFQEYHRIVREAQHRYHLTVHPDEA